MPALVVWLYCSNVNTGETDSQAKETKALLLTWFVSFFSNQAAECY